MLAVVLLLLDALAIGVDIGVARDPDDGGQDGLEPAKATR